MQTDTTLAPTWGVFFPSCFVRLFFSSFSFFSFSFWLCFFFSLALSFHLSSLCSLTHCLRSPRSSFMLPSIIALCCLFFFVCKLFFLLVFFIFLGLTLLHLKQTARRALTRAQVWFFARFFFPSAFLIGAFLSCVSFRFFSFLFFFLLPFSSSLSYFTFLSSHRERLCMYCGWDSFRQQYWLCMWPGIQRGQLRLLCNSEVPVHAPQYRRERVSLHCLFFHWDTVSDNDTKQERRKGGERRRGEGEKGEWRGICMVTQTLITLFSSPLKSRTYKDRECTDVQIDIPLGSDNQFSLPNTVALDGEIPTSFRSGLCTNKRARTYVFRTTQRRWEGWGDIVLAHSCFLTLPLCLVQIQQPSLVWVSLVLMLWLGLFLVSKQPQLWEAPAAVLPVLAIFMALCVMCMAALHRKAKLFTR